MLLPGQRAGGPVADRVRSIDEPMWTITDRGVGNKIASQVRLEVRELPSVSVVETDKPPYRIPTMAEIRAIPPTGRIVVSTFSGAGGSCLGFRLNGFRIAFASEFVQAARDTYRANADPSTWLDERDIRTVSGESIRELAGIGEREIDVLEGSPPCASFSTAGRRQEHWGREKSYSDTRQRADDLFDEYVRIVRELRPRMFVAENVSGLVKGVAKGYAIEILAALRASGYRVAARLLDAQWLGVPQARVRLIIVGIRDDLVGEPADVFPTPLPYRYSVRDALPEISAIEQATGHNGHPYLPADGPAETVLAGRPVRVVGGPGGPFNSKGREFPLDAPLPTVSAQVPQQYKVEVRTSVGPRSLDEPAPTILTHGRRGTESELTIAAPSIEPYAIGREWDRLVPGEQSDKYLNLVRPAADEPVPTVTALGGQSGGVASVTHPFEPRKFTIDELRRLSGFPPDFVLTGTYAQQWERIGRAVPPPMMAAVARGVLAALDRMDA